MHPEDRVLVAVITRPKDFEIARDPGWYRVPEKKAPRGIFAEYIAFYFTAALGEQAYAVHYYARRLGHELVTRRQLLPDEPDHPRVDERYYKLQLAPLQKREPPIVSQRWRRITFIHTTWDRFQAAEEINDLFADDEAFVDRLYHALRDSGLSPERQYPVREADVEYVATLAVPCREGVLSIEVGDVQPHRPERLLLTPDTVTADLPACLQAVQTEVERRGGIQPYPKRSMS
ncbi:MAG: hypothetical protein PVG11_00625 [Anaerolineae bacterium]|jgi:hypothetical protein